MAPTPTTMLISVGESMPGIPTYEATTADFRAVEIDDFGLAIRFPTIDADFYVPSLIAGRLDSENRTARRRAKAGTE